MEKYFKAYRSVIRSKKTNYYIKNLHRLKICRVEWKWTTSICFWKTNFSASNLLIWTYFLSYILKLGHYNESRIFHLPKYIFKADYLYLLTLDDSLSSNCLVVVLPTSQMHQMSSKHQVEDIVCQVKIGETNIKAQNHFKWTHYHMLLFNFICTVV